MKSSAWIGLFAAVSSSVCCVLPLATFIAGTAGLAAKWHWIEPLRPYLVVATVGALGFAWYQQLGPLKEACCRREDGSKKRTFWQGRIFLSFMTGAALLLLALPSYSYLLVTQEPEESIQASRSPIQVRQQEVHVTIKGMTCSGCEQHIKQALLKLKGISEAKVSYQKGEAVVKYDDKKASLASIRAAVDATGYQVVNAKVKNQ